MSQFRSGAGFTGGGLTSFNPLERLAASQQARSNQMQGQANLRANQGANYGAMNQYQQATGTRPPGWHESAWNQLQRQTGVNPSDPPDFTTFASATMPQGSQVDQGYIQRTFGGPQIISQEEQAQMRAGNQQMAAQGQDNQLRRMGYTGEGAAYDPMRGTGDPRAQGMSSSILSYYQPGHQQYEQELQRMQGIQQGISPYTGQRFGSALAPLNAQSPLFNALRP